MATKLYRAWKPWKPAKLEHEYQNWWALFIRCSISFEVLGKQALCGTINFWWPWWLKCLDILNTWLFKFWKGLEWLWIVATTTTTTTTTTNPSVRKWKPCVTVWSQCAVNRQARKCFDTWRPWQVNCLRTPAHPKGLAMIQLRSLWEEVDDRWKNGRDFLAKVVLQACFIHSSWLFCLWEMFVWSKSD